MEAPMTHEQPDDEAFGVRMHRVEAHLDDFSRRLRAVEHQLASANHVAAPAPQLVPPPLAPIGTTAQPELAASFTWAVPVEDVRPVDEEIAIQIPGILPGTVVPERGRPRRTAYVRSDSTAPSEVDWEKLVS